MKQSKNWIVILIHILIVIAGIALLTSCQSGTTQTIVTDQPEPTSVPASEGGEAVEEEPAAEATSDLVYYLAPVLIDEYQVGSQLFIEDYGQELGYTVKSLNANNNANTQISQMEDAMGQNPLAIIVNAVDADTIASTVDKAREEGIIVLAYDRLIPTTDVDLSATAATIRMGRLAAERSIKYLESKYGEPKGLILEVTGDPGDYNAVYIDEGFMEIMEGYPNVEVIRREALGWEPTVAASLIDDQLTARGEEIDLLFAHGDHWMPAIANVLQSHGYAPGDPRLYVIGTGGTPTGLEGIRDGWLQETVDYPMAPEYKAMFDFLDELVAGEDIEPGPYVVDGFENEIILDEWGPTVWVGAEVISKEGGDGTLNVDDPSLWGNVELPSE